MLWAMFSAKVTESLKMNSFVEESSPLKKITAAIVGSTKVAMMVESKNFARKDHGFPLVFMFWQKKIEWISEKRNKLAHS